jgi:hypothetical protein
MEARTENGEVAAYTLKGSMNIDVFFWNIIGREGGGLIVEINKSFLHLLTTKYWMGVYEGIAKTGTRLTRECSAFSSFECTL